MSEKSLARTASQQYNEHKPASHVQNRHEFIDPIFTQWRVLFMDIINNPGGVDISPPSVAKERRVSLFEQININVFWIANNFHWNALLAVAIPSMVAKL